MLLNYPFKERVLSFLSFLGSLDLRTLMVGWVVTFSLVYIVWSVDIGSSFMGFMSFFPICNGYFKIDTVSFVLGLTTLIVWLALTTCYHFEGSYMITLSVIMSLACFSSNNMLVFWFSYEMAILSLFARLYLDSPYSERLKACWYLTLYVVSTSVPMLLCFLYLGAVQGSFSLNPMASAASSAGSQLSIVVLLICFIIKVPLAPFHSWLPVVHSEASSVVSACLSGFVMKLGICGVYRFCTGVLCDSLHLCLVGFLVILSGMCFFLFSDRELDCKRWLAFLSLAHMSGCCFSILAVSPSNFVVPLLICLGHGLSSSLSFLFFSIMQQLAGTRNWAIIKSCCQGSSFLFFMAIFVILFNNSFPPTLSFLAENLTLVDIGPKSTILAVSYLLYLVCSGSYPIIALGCILNSSKEVEVLGTKWFNQLLAVSFLSVVNIVLPLLMLV